MSESAYKKPVLALEVVSMMSKITEDKPTGPITWIGVKQFLSLLETRSVAYEIFHGL